MEAGAWKVAAYAPPQRIWPAWLVNAASSNPAHTFLHSALATPHKDDDQKPDECSRVIRVALFIA
jgi:hypothetical protein